MTGARQPGDPAEDHQAPAWSMLSDEELAEVVAEAVISEDVLRAEATLLGPDAAASSDKDRITRIEVDRRMVDLLASTGFSGEKFESAFRQLIGQLIGYAHPIIGLWVRDGSIFHECLRYRGRIGAGPTAAALAWTDEESDEESEEAVLDTLLLAANFFLDYGLRKRKWDHRRGATLATYFVGACVCTFIKVCNDRWKQQQLQEAFIHSGPRDAWEEDVDLADTIKDPGMDPADMAVLRVESASVLEKISDPQVRRVLALRATGMTQVAAAAEVGMTAKAVERRLHTQRRKLRPPNPSSGTEDEGSAS
jgi:DNA-directed RNA polymerase specialized sigma24 family protein